MVEQISFKAMMSPLLLQARVKCNPFVKWVQYGARTHDHDGMCGIAVRTLLRMTQRGWAVPASVVQVSVYYVVSSRYSRPVSASSWLCGLMLRGSVNP
jgi:hypothetical protein